MAAGGSVVCGLVLRALAQWRSDYSDLQQAASHPYDPSLVYVQTVAAQIKAKQDFLVGLNSAAAGQQAGGAGLAGFGQVRSTLAT